MLMHDGYQNCRRRDVVKYVVPIVNNNFVGRQRITGGHRAAVAA